MSYFDENGNEVTDVLPPDKAKELQSKLEQTEQELNKLKSKDYNFSELRKKTEDEKQEIMKGWTEKEKSLYMEIDGLKNRVDETEKKGLAEFEASLLSQLAGSNEELKNKIKENAKIFPNAPVDKEDLANRYRTIFNAIRGESGTTNPLNTYAPVGGNAPETQNKTRFTDTQAGKDILQQKFAGVIEKAKRRNPNINL